MNHISRMCMFKLSMGNMELEEDLRDAHWWLDMGTHFTDCYVNVYVNVRDKRTDQVLLRFGYAINCNRPEGNRHIMNDVFNLDVIFKEIHRAWEQVTQVGAQVGGVL